MTNRRAAVLVAACLVALCVSAAAWAGDQTYVLTPELLQSAVFRCETLLARLGGLCLNLLTLRGPNEARIDATIDRLYDECSAMEADAIALLDHLDYAEAGAGSPLSARLEFVRAVADSVKWAVRGAGNGLWAAERREWDHVELWTWHVMQQRDNIAALLALYEVVSGGN
jgi:hypothetical protein